MRRARFALVTAAIIATLAGMWLAFAWYHPPTLVPAASIRLVSYTNFTTSNPGRDDIVYPGTGSWLQAQMVLTNEGRVSISYAAWGNEPYGWANVETGHGKTNGYLAPPFTGGTALLRPRSVAKFWVILPTNTLRWQCGFEIDAASVRERGIWRVLESKFCRRAPGALFYPVRWLPDKTGPSLDLKSGVLEVSDTAGPPHNKSLQPTTAAPGS